MVLDISKIIADKLAQLEESGEIKAYIEAEVEKSERPGSWMPCSKPCRRKHGYNNRKRYASK